MKDPCKQYKEDFIEKHDYLFCENCRVNENGTFAMSVHHIVYRSEAPKHPELNNMLNLILLCARCHEMFHSDKKLRNDIVASRGLCLLFNRNLHIYDKN